jgi:hypothetical protein
MTTGATVIIAALIGAVAALVGNALSNLSNFAVGERSRRRRIIAEAVEVAFDRVEVLYMIRRRSKDKKLRVKDDIEIRNEMHRIQSKTKYYTTIVSSESAWLGSSYEKLISIIKSETEPLLQKAWKEQPKGISEVLKGSNHPLIESARRDFIRDTQLYFNPLKRCWFGLIYKIQRTKDTTDYE